MQLYATRRHSLGTTFLKWLEEAVVSEKETELSIDQNYMNIGLLKRYIWEKASIQLPDTGEHAAIVHYSATPDTNAILYPKGFYS